MTAPPVLELGVEPESRRQVVAAAWAHRRVLAALARADFEVRYKRAFLGVAWVVAIPLLQGLLLAAILSRAVRFGSGESFAAYVLTGMLPWVYLQTAMVDGSIAVVTNAGIADKIWFPRALLPLVAPMSNLAGLAISAIVVIVALPLLGVRPGLTLLVLVPAAGLLVAFTSALSLVLSALHVYARDVKHLVQATLLLWFYATPIFYPPDLLGDFEPLLVCNPMTGIVALFRLATLGEAGDDVLLAVAVSCLTTLLLAVLAVELYRRLDRLFVDRL